jgi:hypothetical protein
MTPQILALIQHLKNDGAGRNTHPCFNEAESIGVTLYGYRIRLQQGCDGNAADTIGNRPANGRRFRASTQCGSYAIGHSGRQLTSNRSSQSFNEVAV